MILHEQTKRRKTIVEREKLDPHNRHEKSTEGAMISRIKALQEHYCTAGVQIES